MKNLNSSFKFSSAIFLFLILFSGNVFSQALLTEDFNYTAGTLLTANGWTAHSGAGTNALTVSTPGLTYSGYVGSGIGNAVTMTTSGEDGNKSLSSSQSSGTVYYAFMIKVTASQTTGDYFLHFNQSATVFFGKTFIKKDPATTNFALGISKNSNTANYTGYNYALNTTYLVVIKYTFVTGATNDYVDMFVNPVINGTEPTPTITCADITGTDATSLIATALRQGTAANAPSLVVDRIRAGTTWNSVVPMQSSPAINVSVATLSFPLTNSGTASASQSFTVSGTNLTAPIIIVPPNPFEISTDNSTWIGSTGNISLSPTGGTVNTTTIYARFNPVTIGTFSGNIIHTSTGATTQNVAVTGTAPAYFYYSGSGDLSNTLNWGSNPDGTGNNPPDFSTKNQVFYIVNSASVNLGTDWTVSGTSSKVVLGNSTDPVEFIISPTNVLTGTIDLSANSTLTIQNTTIGHTYGTINSASTINYAQSGTYVIPQISYGNLILTGGTKTFAGNTTTISGNLTVDNVTGLCGTSASPFSTVNLAGNFTLLSSTTFGPATNGFTLVCNGSSVQTLTGNNIDFNLFRITTVNSAGVVLSNSGGTSNLTLGNASGGGYTLTTGNLTLNNNTLAFYTNGKATIVAGTGTLTCSPLSNIIISGNGTSSIGSLKFTTGSETFNNLTVNITGTTNTVSLGTAATINGTLTLTSGILSLGANSLTLGTSSVISGTPSAANMVDATGTGQLIKSFTGTGSFTYPVGNSGASGVYSPATLNFTSGTFSSAKVGVNLAAAKYVNNNSVTDYLKRSWTVTQTGISGFSCDASFLYSTGDVVGTESNIYVGKYSGIVWELLGQTDYTNHILSANGINGFSTFTGGELSAMPVNMVSFNSSVSKQIVRLSWTTASEINNAGFEIQRSYENGNWSAVGFVKGNGTKNSASDYSFSDNNLSPGKYNYRLKQSDNNGNYTYHNLGTTVEIETPKKFELSQNYPNPFNPSTKIDYAIPQNGKVTMIIYDVLGKELLRPVNSDHKAGYYTVEISSGKLSSGIYFYRLFANVNGQTNTITKKMLMIK